MYGIFSLVIQKKMGRIFELKCLTEEHAGVDFAHFFPPCWQIFSLSTYLINHFLPAHILEFRKKIPPAHLYIFKKMSVCLLIPGCLSIMDFRVFWFWTALLPNQERKMKSMQETFYWSFFLWIRIKFKAELNDWKKK